MAQTFPRIGLQQHVMGEPVLLLLFIYDFLFHENVQLRVKH